MQPRSLCVTASVAFVRQLGLSQYIRACAVPCSTRGTLYRQVLLSRWQADDVIPALAPASHQSPKQLNLGNLVVSRFQFSWLLYALDGYI